MFTHPETKEEESKSCTSERREQSLGGEGPVEILGTTRTPSKWDDKECGARRLIKGREQVVFVCVDKWG